MFDGWRNVVLRASGARQSIVEEGVAVARALKDQGERIAADVGTRAGKQERRGIVIMHPDRMVVVPENPHSFSTVHSFE